MRLIFLHGGPGYPDYLEPFFSDAFQDDIKPVFYSQIQTDPISIEDLVAELDQKVWADSRPVILVGHSWGGAFAVEYYRRKFPPHIKGIVLIGAFLCADDATTEYRRELELRRLENPTTEQVFLTPSEVSLAGSLIDRLTASFNVRCFRALWDGFISAFDARSFIASSKIPVLNIFGENDIRIPARKVREYSKLSPFVKNVEIEEAGHFPFIHEKDREAVTRAIEGFAIQLSDLSV